MSTPEQPQEKQEQPAAVEYSYKTDIAILIRSVSKDTHEDILNTLTQEKEASKICAMEMGITLEESIAEQQKIKPIYKNVLGRLQDGENAEETIQICIDIMGQHMRSTAWNNLMNKKYEEQDFEIPEEESDGDIILGSEEPAAKEKLPPPNFEEIQKMTKEK